jgi:N-acetylglucosaminyldiphosphoundecaprenol N-acetyl-beta-D-mannosaminyltransferase
MEAIWFSNTPKDDPPGRSSERPQYDDLAREVYCLLGIPVDAVDMTRLVHTVEEAAANKTPLLISTPNLNFLVASHRDPEFRETLLLSELCPPDGMPLVWIARLLGLPIHERVAGSDLLATLKTNRQRGLRLFLFGGAEGVAAAAAKKLNEGLGGLSCVGFMFPGFGSIEDMSQEDVIEKINKTRADFLVAALGAQKGQLWLRRNHNRLQIPVRAHLGAAVNFEAGNITRAPIALRKLGLEWLWRIKEEPHLWRRYWSDGALFVKLLFSRVLPLAIYERWQLFNASRQGLVIEVFQDDKTVTLELIGAAIASNVGKATVILREAVGTKKTVRLNLSRTRAVDARFLGLFLMLRKYAKNNGVKIAFCGASSQLQTIFRLNEVGFLLAQEP